MGCGVERSSCSLWSGLNAVVSLSSYERMLSACITTSRNKKEKCFFKARGREGQVMAGESERKFTAFEYILLASCIWDIPG